jgi:uncharacterized protein YdgA (DUF945 family)
MLGINKMKKLLALVVLVVILLIGGAPYFVGMLLPRHVDKTIAYINAQHQGISLEKVSLERHWFSSNIVIKAHIDEGLASSNSPSALSVAGLTNANKTVDITLNSVVRHGPMMMGTDVEGKKRLKLGLGFVHFAVFPKDISNIGDSMDLSRLATLVKDQPLFTVTNLITFLLEDKISFKSASVHHQDEQGKIDWDGVIGKIWLNARGNRITVELVNSPLTFEGKDGQKISASELTFKMSHHKDSNGLWVGQSDVSIPKLSVSNKTGDIIDLKAGKLDVSTRSQKELFEGTINASFTELNHNQRVYGPLTLKTTLDHLDAKALATIAQFQATADQNYNAIANLVRQNQLLTAITQLLSNKPKLTVDTFSLKTPEGLMTLKGAFSLDEQTRQPGGFLQLEPFIRSINLALDLTLPTPLAERLAILMAGFYPNILLSKEELNNPNLVFTQEQLNERANQRLQAWHDAKLVTKNENEYTISFKLAGGLIKLNNVVVNLTQPPLAEGEKAPAQVSAPAAVQQAEPVLEAKPAEKPAPTKEATPAPKVVAPANKPAASEKHPAAAPAQ